MDLLEKQSKTLRRHPWELVRFSFFARHLKQNSEPVHILDAGAGDGWFACSLLALLPSGSSITCFDINYTPEHLSSLQSGAPTGISFTATPPTRTFDFLLLLDVAEHVENDIIFLKNLVDTYLSPQGGVLFSVPAWPCLFSDHDRFLHHFRRYTPGRARDILKQSGLVITKSGGVFHAPLVARALVVCLEKLKLRKPQNTPEFTWNHGSMITAFTTVILYSDTLVSRTMGIFGIGFPGLSWWALCQKHT